VAATFRVSVASVVKSSQRFRATGSAAAHKVGGPKRFKFPPACAEVRFMPFHGGNTGSSPLGCANNFNDLAQGFESVESQDQI
jgi:hypothetical protein